MDPRRNIYLTRLAPKLKISRDVLRREMRLLGIQKSFSDITDSDLDAMMKDFQLKKCNMSGVGYAVGHARSKGLRLQRHRIRASIQRVNWLGQAVRQQAREKTKRRKYNVSRPNALWHIDGHHKLIAWGIVIHGCVDGFSRTVRSYLFTYSFSPDSGLMQR